MQKASVGSRPPQTVSETRSPARTPLRLIYGGSRDLTQPFLDLLGFLVFLLGLRSGHASRKSQVAEGENGLYDDIPDTGVRSVFVPRGPAEVPSEIPPASTMLTDDAIDEILREAAPVSRPRKELVELEDSDPVPKKVMPHALGQFARAFLKARGGLGEHIDRLIDQRIGKRKASELGYAERLHMRRLERRALQDQLLRMALDEGRLLRDTQESLEAGVSVIHIQKGPSKSYFVRFDPVSGVVLGFYSAEGYNRHKAYRRARKKSFREGGRRFH